MNIALIEDNSSILEYLVTLLQYGGHLCFPYADAASFLDTLWNTSQDNDPALLHIPMGLVILDLMLPGTRSGMDILHMLRETETPHSHLPLIVISGVGQNILNDIHTRFPTVPVLRKPFHMRDLLILVDAIGVTSETKGEVLDPLSLPLRKATL